MEVQWESTEKTDKFTEKEKGKPIQMAEEKESQERKYMRAREPTHLVVDTKVMSR